MVEEKRMAGDYEVQHAIQVGHVEVLFGENPENTDMRYMVCNCDRDNPLGMEAFTDASGSSDFLEMMTEFSDRVRANLQEVRGERGQIEVPLEPLDKEQCTPIDSDTDLTNMVVVLSPEALRPEYRTADKQILIVRGGFGASANSRGRAVFTVNVYSGKRSRWNREDIIGRLYDDQMPEWARAKMHEYIPVKRIREEQAR